jgi:hypothetical protein
MSNSNQDRYKAGDRKSFEDWREAVIDEQRMQYDDLASKQGPKMREILAQNIETYACSCEDCQAFAHACSDHVLGLPDNEPRFRLLASYSEIDGECLIETYYTYFVGCDSFATCAWSQYIDQHPCLDDRSVDEFVTLVLLDALAFAVVAYPEAVPSTLTRSLRPQDCAESSACRHEK